MRSSIYISVLLFALTQLFGAPALARLGSDQLG
jgi:hypothetical protein